jgi:hypothetical protein
MSKHTSIFAVAVLTGLAAVAFAPTTAFAQQARVVIHIDTPHPQVITGTHVSPLPAVQFNGRPTGPVGGATHPSRQVTDGALGHDAPIAQAKLLQAMQAYRHGWTGTVIRAPQ